MLYPTIYTTYIDKHTHTHTHIHTYTQKHSFQFHFVLHFTYFTFDKNSTKMATQIRTAKQAEVKSVNNIQKDEHNSL